MNRQHLLSRLGRRGWQILYSSGPQNLWNRNSAGFKQAPLLSGFKAADGVTVDIAGKLSSRWPKLGWWDRWALNHHARRLHNRSGKSVDILLYVFEPVFADYIDLLPHSRLVYHPYDLFSTMTASNPQRIADAEKRLVEQADLVIGTSPGVIEALPMPATKQAVLLPNGANIPDGAGIGDLPCPDDLAAIPGPRIGYVGTLNPKLDFGLLAELADMKKDWSFVFVGPDLMSRLSGRLKESERQAFALFSGMQNVYLLGLRPQNAVPHYIANMSVNIIPYVIEKGHWANAGSPLKVFEYLSVGKPVVTADLHIMRSLADVVAIADGAESWISALENAIDHGGTGSAATRFAKAKENSWDNRVETLNSLLETL